MKKILIIAVTFLLIGTGRSYALGLLNTTSTANNNASGAAGTNVLKTNTQTNLTDNLKQRADTEIQRRLDALNDLSIRINLFRRLSSAQKADFTTQIKTQIDSLTALKAKIDADSDLTTLKADVKSIITDYRIFAFFIKDINLLAASDRILALLDNMNAVYGKLQTRINQAQADGKDVASLNTLLADMKTQTDSATALVNDAVSELTGLTVQGYPANQTSLADARTKLKEAFKDIKAAYEDAKQIIQNLKTANNLQISTHSALQNQ